MKYICVTSSRTGNTGMLAETASEVLAGDQCLYFGAPSDEAVSASHEADIVLAGFWTDRGSCSDEMKKFLNRLENCRIFLFGTAGFGGEPAYFEKILNNVSTCISSSCTVCGTFMCQGKMPDSVLMRYEKILAENPDDRKTAAMIENFRTALSHPDTADTDKFRKVLLSSV